MLRQLFWQAGVWSRSPDAGLCESALVCTRSRAIHVPLDGGPLQVQGETDRPGDGRHLAGCHSIIRCSGSGSAPAGACPAFGTDTTGLHRVSRFPPRVFRFPHVELAVFHGTLFVSAAMSDLLTADLQLFKGFPQGAPREGGPGGMEFFRGLIHRDDQVRIEGHLHRLHIIAMIIHIYTMDKDRQGPAMTSSTTG